MPLFDYLGAFYFWIFLVVKSKIQNNKPPTFREIKNGKGRYNKNNLVDFAAYGLKLKVIGISVSMFFIYFILKMGF